MASSARLDELKKKFDENPRRYFAPLANELRKSGDLDQAISLCRTHLPQQPGHISGHIVLAQALFEAGSLDESRENFHSALGLDPENLIALRYLGDIAKESADLETARTWYQRVLEVDPRNEEIEQLVRDLDSPRPAESATEASAETTDEPQSTFAPAPASPATPRAPVNTNDARFAPLSMDEIDIDDLTPASDGHAGSTAGDSTASPVQDPFNAYGGWTGDSGSAGLPTLDEPEIDPFDLNPAASAEALYDPSSPPPKDDIFASATEQTSEPPQSPYVTNSWSSTAEPAAPARGDEGAMFEEGSFYLEPPPPAPDESTPSESPAARSVSDEGSTESDDQESEGMDAFAAEYYPPARDAHQRTPLSSDAFQPVAPAEPNAEAVASSTAAEAPTAEWHQPVAEAAPAPSAPTADDGLGLEVMEFVPPSSQPAAPASPAPMTAADPLLGHTLDIDADQGATPDAFVTETMAELYLQQGFRNEALAVYRDLLTRNPDDASLRERVAQIESGSMSSLGMATLSESVVESALKRQTARPGRSVRSFFASFAGRRAPAAPQREIDETESGDVSLYAPADDAAVMAPVELPEAKPVATPEPNAETVAPTRPDPASPLMSAAETLASYDPFADPPDSMPSAPVETPNATPDSLSDNAVNGATQQAPVSARVPTPTATPVEPASARRSLEDLFPDTAMTGRTETAAQTLATAFGRPEPQGRPTRAASNELSLDNVFRGAPEGAPAPDGGFSFDQFFSDSRAGGDVSSPSASSPEMGRSGGSPDAHDIEQFTAWLEGLKKK